MTNNDAQLQNKLDHILTLNRLRQAKYYEANREKINLKRREKLAQLKSQFLVAPKKAPAPINSYVDYENDDYVVASTPITTPTVKQSTKVIEPTRKSSRIQTIQNKPVIVPVVEPVAVKSKKSVVPVIVPVTKNGKKIPDTKYNLKHMLTKIEALDINDSTKIKYKHDITTMFLLTKCPDMVECLKKPDEILDKIQNGTQLSDETNTKKYAINSQLGFLQIILFCIDTFKFPISPETKERYADLYDLLKAESKEQTEIRNSTKVVLPFADYLQLIEDKFGSASKQNLLSNLYFDVTCRDDYAEIVLVEDETDADDKKLNYIVLPLTGNASVVLNHFKTGKKYGVVKRPFSEITTDLLRKYITNKKTPITYGDKLFKSKNLSDYVVKMNKAIGESGGINIFRNMRVTDQKDNSTLVEKLALSKTMGHSLETQKRYQRKHSAPIIY